MNFENVKEFFPTPDTLLEKITEGMDFSRIETVLEPEAGKGNIVDFLLNRTSAAMKHFDKRECRWWNPLNDIDCIEKSEELRSVLKGKNYRVVHDDFLTFHTYKHYDLIFMNPPFSEGAKHLLKAIELQKNGGNIICILNAETIRNPFTKERQVLAQELASLHADISFYTDEFTSAERPTSVEVAVVKIAVPQKEEESRFFEEAKEKLKKRSFSEYAEQEQTELVSADFIEAIVAQYNAEVSSGIALIKEYQALRPHIMEFLGKESYNAPILTLKLENKDNLSINDYVKMVRRKYWTAIFADRRFTGKMTDNQYQEYASKVRNLEEYDFSYYNIKEMQVTMTKNLVRGIEDTIIKLFDDMSHTYSWEPRTAHNIHYYNGWATNKSWIINKKVILPYYNAWSDLWKKYRYDFQIVQKLSDIDKVLNYLAGGISDGGNIGYILDKAEKEQQTKDIRFRYFSVTFYKKGTCHIEFTDDELLKKFNIFGSQQKRWLPPSYGKKTYEQMNAEERTVVDEFEGKEEYAKTLSNANYYIYSPDNGFLLDQVS